MIELQIDELILHGFAPDERYRIGAAIERELTRLLAERGLSLGIETDGLDLGRVDGGDFAVPHDASGQAIGTQVARAVFDSLAAGDGRAVAASGRRVTGTER